MSVVVGPIGKCGSDRSFELVLRECGNVSDISSDIILKSKVKVVFEMSVLVVESLESPVLSFLRNE